LSREREEKTYGIKKISLMGWGSGNPVRYLVFIAFIFLIVVVLMNLLNGLAVSDTGLIRS